MIRVIRKTDRAIVIGLDLDTCMRMGEIETVDVFEDYSAADAYIDEHELDRDIYGIECID